MDYRFPIVITYVENDIYGKSKQSVRGSVSESKFCRLRERRTHRLDGQQRKVHRHADRLLPTFVRAAGSAAGYVKSKSLERLVRPYCRGVLHITGCCI